MAKSNDHVDQHRLFNTSVPKMPEGYYSGDKPNPNLRAFVEEHIKEHPYDPATDDYDVPAFDRAIDTTKATAIYNMHTYWSKKPHDAIREYIKHYTKPGDLVIDPFCGSGGTALAALLEGRKAVAADLSPAATFIAKNYCSPVDIPEFQDAFEELKRLVAPEIDWLYGSSCERCGGKATISYTVFSQVFQCSRCLEKIPLSNCVEVDGKTASGKDKKINVCPFCHRKGLFEEISTRGEKFGSVPVMVSYECNSGCKPKRSSRKFDSSDVKTKEYFDKYDLKKLIDIEAKEIPYWYPRHKMMNVEDDSIPWGVEWREGRNFRNVSDLFTKRNLWALSLILDKINQLSSSYKSSLVFSLTSILLKSSRMMAHNNDGIGRIQKGTYYIPQLIHDINVWKFMEEAVGDMILGYKAISGIFPKLMVSTSDARKLDIPTSSVDYIFTDPPYADKVQYGELNFIWEAWLNFDTKWIDNEIIINEIRGKSEIDWANMMREAMSECFRVLKPGRCISVCYHDTSEGTWELMQDIMAEVGFIVEKSEIALFIDSKTKTTNQYFADKVNKRDLVINFVKPRSGQLSAGISITGNEDGKTFSDKVRSIIRDFLCINPGITKDRIYDEVVSHMVRAGRMEAHNFDELLSQVAEEVSAPIKKNLFEEEDPNLFGTHKVSRWYLKGSELDIQDSAESAKEDAAAEQISKFVASNLEKHQTVEGVHYSDIFEQFVYTVKDKPRRPLAEWLLDYFFKTIDGTYRLPNTEEEKRLKAEGRSKGTQRSIKRYIAFLQQGIAIPEKERPNDSTLTEWIRHCKRSGLYEQGKLLYEKGGLNLDGLGEEAMVNVEEDYQVCVRMLARGGVASTDAKPKRGRKA